MCGHVWMAGMWLCSLAMIFAASSVQQRKNGPAGRPVTVSHFILPVRARKPLPRHNPSPCNLSASRVSAVAVETTVKGKISSPTPEVTHKTHSRACSTAYAQQHWLIKHRGAVQKDLRSTANESGLWKRPMEIEMSVCVPQRSPSAFHCGQLALTGLLRAYPGERVGN